MRIAVSNEAILLVIRFKIGGSLRFLSHAETLRLFQRACIRAGIQIRYSQGFNPRPKLSLPLPRTVGVESEDDLLCLRVSRDTNQPQIADYESRIKAELSGQLPGGCELLSVSVVGADTSFQPVLATYVLTVQPQYLSEKLKDKINHLMANESLNLHRRIDAKGNIRTVDVRRFLKSIEIMDESIIIVCNISSDGTIRVEEILNLLELDVEKLAAPIRRTSVKWKEV